jgi:ribosomal protein L24E
MNNALKLKRDKRKIRWTEAFHEVRAKAKVRAKEKEEKPVEKEKAKAAEKKEEGKK